MDKTPTPDSSSKSFFSQISWLVTLLFIFSGQLYADIQRSDLYRIEYDIQSKGKNYEGSAVGFYEQEISMFYRDKYSITSFELKFTVSERKDPDSDVNIRIQATEKEGRAIRLNINSRAAINLNEAASISVGNGQSQDSFMANLTVTPLSEEEFQELLSANH